MHSSSPHRKQRLAFSATFFCGVLLGSLAVISLSSLSSCPGVQHELFRRSDDATVNTRGEPDHHLQMVRRDDPLAIVPDKLAGRPEFKFGYPAPVADVVVADAYVSVYDRRTRNPHWAAEYLTKANLLPPPNEEPVRENNFSEDTSIPLQFRARLSSYKGSKYDRGHQAPAADAKRSKKARDETFLLSNMAPQVGNKFNRHYWADFEKYVRDLTNRFDHVHVFTGPLYMPTDAPSNGKGNVTYEVLYGPRAGVAPISVPTHFYKSILVTTDEPSSQALGSFILPNAAISNTRKLSEFSVAIDQIEVAAGVVLFDKIDRTKIQPLCEATTCDLRF